MNSPSDQSRKETGTYYTPHAVAASLVRWAVRHPNERMLDPACGDGQFLALHRKSAGVERRPSAAKTAIRRAPWAMIHDGEFFSWASQTDQRFDCAAGNPPFIRYQHFRGRVRRDALALCNTLGASFSSLTSSWAPFLVASASLLHKGGRMAFVVPAEIGHAPYAKPLLEYLANHFGQIYIVAVQRKLFSKLSEDCWLLYAEDRGSKAQGFNLIPIESFVPSAQPPRDGTFISLAEWRAWNGRLRPFLTSSTVRSIYRDLGQSGTEAVQLGEIAKVGIGYVTGANRFFHLTPSRAHSLGIPREFLQPTVRAGKDLPQNAVTHATLQRWYRQDEPILLLRIPKEGKLTPALRGYLDSAAGQEARDTYKCRTRDPWYVVPHVSIPHAFLAYMSGQAVGLAANHAKCACTNSVHAIHLTGRMPMSVLKNRWASPLTRLSCELEGHPLGGGMLKLEPSEAKRIVLSDRILSRAETEVVWAGIDRLRSWRHCESHA